MPQPILDTGKALRLAMAARKMKRGQLATLIGLSESQISRLSQGHQPIQGDTLVKIADVFGMKVSEFIALGETQ